MVHFKDMMGGKSDDLKELAELVAMMAGVVEKSFDDAVDALLRFDRDLAEKVIRTDSEINALEGEITEVATRIGAGQNISQKVMRELIGTLRIASDLEKIGDLSKGIARRTLILMDEETQPKELVGGLAHLSEVAMNQIKTVVDAYIERDLSKADRVFMADDDIDTLYTSMFSALISHMSKDPKSVRPSAHLLFCAKNIERIGDHATDIAGAMRQFLTRPETGGLKGFLR